MRIYGGFSTKIGGKVRAGLSSAGTVWAGVRGRKGGAYGGVIVGKGKGQTRKVEGITPVMEIVLFFLYVAAVIVAWRLVEWLI